jgi:hypothetical protein
VGAINIRDAALSDIVLIVKHQLQDQRH